MYETGGSQFEPLQKERHSPKRDREIIPGLPETGSRLAHLVGNRVVQPFSATSVKNSVLWINPGISEGNPFTAGEPTDLAVQVAMGENVHKPDRVIYAHLGHNRSALLTADAKIQPGSGGDTYPYIDAKGIGHLGCHSRKYRNGRYSLYMKRHEIRPKHKGNEVMGLASEEDVDLDVQMSQRFLDLGIRTTPLIAVTRIEEVMGRDGTRLSLVEAAEKCMIPENFKPVIVFRAWKTPFRLGDITCLIDTDKEFGVAMSERDIERKRVMLQAALLEIKNSLSVDQVTRDSIHNMDVYLTWLVKSIGEGLGIMHANGLRHNYLGALHNITLDARFVDFDGVTEHSQPHELKAEADDLFHPRNHFFGSFLSTFSQMYKFETDPNELLRLAEEAYTESYGGHTKDKQEN